MPTYLVIVPSTKNREENQLRAGERCVVFNVVGRVRGNLVTISFDVWTSKISTETTIHCSGTHGLIMLVPPKRKRSKSIVMTVSIRPHAVSWANSASASPGA